MKIKKFILLVISLGLNIDIVLADPNQTLLIINSLTITIQFDDSTHTAKATIPVDQIGKTLHLSLPYENQKHVLVHECNNQLLKTSKPIDCGPLPYLTFMTLEDVTEKNLTVNRIIATIGMGIGGTLAVLASFLGGPELTVGIGLGTFPGGILAAAIAPLITGDFPDDDFGV